MNKKEIAEIKRRFKKESCTFTTMCGCYVDASKEKVVTFRETFLNLEDEEFHKYLEIAGKCLSGTLGNNLLELEFPIEEEAPGGHQQILMALRDSRLTDDNLVNAYYDLIIDTYDYVGNYLILLFHDAYDVPMKTKDNLDLGDSEEVYEYLLCAICPVTLSKPGLGYREAEHRIGARDRDWIVGATETGFTFPCFTERSTDIHSVLVYTKNAKEPHREFWENGLGCRSKQTTAEKQNAFTNMVTQALGPDDEETGEKILDIQQSLNEFVLAEEEKMDKDDPLPFTPEAVTEVLTEGGVPVEKAERIQKNYEEYFEDTLPDAKELLDPTALKANEPRAEKKVLQEKVADLTKKLEEAGVIGKDGKEADIVVKVSPEKLPLVTSAFVDGHRCLVIPLDDDEQACINGEEREL